jgi:predicted Fe-S protein YdhL (DUF1289 family)
MRQPPSPCIGICRIDASDMCSGCLRTLDEIADWPILSVREKDALLFRLEDRRRLAQKQQQQQQQQQ